MNYFQDIPIFIVNYNQLACLRKLLDWLVGAGYRRIHVLDNRSTYPPLLRYYDEVDRTHKGVIKKTTLEKNYGCRGILTENILDRFKPAGPYIYTDGDVVPDICCPDNLVEHLVSLLDANPDVCKAGLGLRINDLPNSYKFREQVILWEGQHWRKPVGRGLFRAPIDTTFAVYRSGVGFALKPALRTGWPYLARHEPWYSDTSQPNDEERFYQQSSKVHDTHWAGSRMPEWLEEQCRVLASDKKRLINLGCGHDVMGGWINIDVRDDVGADLIFDLDACSANAKLPFADETIDGFYMCDVFGCISRRLSLMQELYRVAKPNAKLIIRGLCTIPNRSVIYQDLVRSFNYFGQSANSGSHDDYSGDWSTRQVKLVVRPHLLEGGAGIFSRPLDSFVRDIIVELVAIKPRRPHQPLLVEWPNLTFASSLVADDIDF
jgi:hypothetical protein